MKKIKPDGSKTLYIGGIYEVGKASGGSVTRTVTYYPVAGAMRIDNMLYYVLKDHLGSANVVTDASGTILGEQRYYPFGETRLYDIFSRTPHQPKLSLSFNLHFPHILIVEFQAAQGFVHTCCGDGVTAHPCCGFHKIDIYSTAQCF